MDTNNTMARAGGASSKPEVIEVFRESVKNVTLPGNINVQLILNAKGHTTGLIKSNGQKVHLLPKTVNEQGEYSISEEDGLKIASLLEALDKFDYSPTGGILLQNIMNDDGELTSAASVQLEDSQTIVVDKHLKAISKAPSDIVFGDRAPVATKKVSIDTDDTVRSTEQLPLPQAEPEAITPEIDIETEKVPVAPKNQDALSDVSNDPQATTHIPLPSPLPTPAPPSPSASPAPPSEASETPSSQASSVSSQPPSSQASNIQPQQPPPNAPRRHRPVRKRQLRFT